MSIDKAEAARKLIFKTRLQEIRAEFRVFRPEFAALLGISLSELYAIENCETQDEISLEFVCHVANVLEISTDYLLGLTDDWEQSPEHQHAIQFQMHLYREQLKREAKTAARLVRFNRKQNKLIRYIERLAHESENCQYRLNRFIELNRAKFREMPAGSGLVNAIEKLNQVSRTAFLVTKHQTGIKL